MTWHHDHMGANAFQGRFFLKCKGNIARDGHGDDGMVPEFSDEHDGFWAYYLKPEAFLNHGEYKAKHVASCTPGDPGAVTVKLLMGPDASSPFVSGALGLRILEHFCTHGTEELGKVPSTPRRTPDEIRKLLLRYGPGSTSDLSDEAAAAREEARMAHEAEKAAEKAREKAEKAAEKAEKARVHLTADQALAAAALKGLTLVPANHATGFMGVSKDGNQFQAKITEGGTRVYLGEFATPEEAALMVAERLGVEGSAAAAAAAAAGSGSSRKRPAESMAPPDSLATTRSGRRVQAPRRESV